MSEHRDDYKMPKKQEFSGVSRVDSEDGGLPPPKSRKPPRKRNKFDDLADQIDAKREARRRPDDTPAVRPTRAVGNGPYGGENGSVPGDDGKNGKAARSVQRDSTGRPDKSDEGVQKEQGSDAISKDAKADTDRQVKGAKREADRKNMGADAVDKVSDAAVQSGDGEAAAIGVAGKAAAGAAKAKTDIDRNRKIGRARNDQAMSDAEARGIRSGDVVGAAMDKDRLQDERDEIEDKSKDKRKVAEVAAKNAADGVKKAAQSGASGGGGGAVPGGSPGGAQGGPNGTPNGTPGSPGTGSQTGVTGSHAGTGDGGAGGEGSGNSSENDSGFDDADKNKDGETGFDGLSDDGGDGSSGKKRAEDELDDKKKDEKKGPLGLKKKKSLADRIKAGIMRTFIMRAIASAGKKIMMIHIMQMLMNMVSNVAASVSSSWLGQAAAWIANAAHAVATTAVGVGTAVVNGAMAVGSFVMHGAAAAWSGVTGAFSWAVGGISSFLGIGTTASTVVAGGVVLSAMSSIVAVIVVTVTTVMTASIRDDFVETECDLRGELKIENMSYTDVPEITGSMIENAEKIYTIYSSYGAAPETIAGILGNWQAESKVDPTAVETIYSEPYTIGKTKLAFWRTYNFYLPELAKVYSVERDYYARFPGIKTLGIGLAQWTNERSRRLLDYAEKQNKNWYDIDVQLAYSMDTTPNTGDTGAASMVDYLSRTYTSDYTSYAKTDADGNPVLDADGNPEYELVCTKSAAFKAAEDFFGTFMMPGRMFKDMIGTGIGDQTFRGYQAEKWMGEIAKFDPDVDDTEAVSSVQDMIGAVQLKGEDKGMADALKECVAGGVITDNEKAAYAAALLAYANQETSDATYVANGSSAPTINQPKSLYRLVKDTVWPGDSGNPYSYASCDRFVVTAVRWSGTDDNFPCGACPYIFKYLEGEGKYNGTCGWQNITDEYDASNWKEIPCGTVMIYGHGENGHVTMYVGQEIMRKVYTDKEGFDEDSAVAAASYLQRQGGCELFYSEYVKGSSSDIYYRADGCAQSPTYQLYSWSGPLNWGEDSKYANACKFGDVTYCAGKTDKIDVVGDDFFYVTD